MMESCPSISAVICTRNRGDRVVATLETLFANTHANFEVIVVDQSTNDDTANAVRRFCGHPRFHYLRTPTRGIGVSRNIGLECARAEIAAFTDDDCTVPPDWLEGMETAMLSYPKVAMVFCNVLPGPHDAAAGFIPDSVRTDNLLLRSIGDKRRGRGIGAGIAVRRSAVLDIGGFDRWLGAGGYFPAGEDIDLEVRLLLKGWWAYETADVSVTHYGFRTWREGAELTQRDWVGIGATYAKPIKCGYWRVAPLIAHELLIYALWRPFEEIFHLRSPRGFKRLVYFWRGFLGGMTTPVDRAHILYASSGYQMHALSGVNT